MTNLKDWIFGKNYGKSWIWIFLTLCISPLLPEYIAPFFITVGYIIFVREQKNAGIKIKLGTIGKVEFLFFGFMLISCIWSPTHIFSAAMAGLWMWMYLIQIMLANYCTDKTKLRRAMQYFTAGSAAAGFIGFLQFTSKIFCKAVGIKSIIPDPLYRYVDEFIYGIMPFAIKTRYFADRSSSTYSNPNVFSTILVLAFPIAIYLLITSKTKKGKLFSLTSLAFIFLGVASTKSRVAFIALIFAMIFSLFVFDKKYVKRILVLILVGCIIIVPFILSRFKNVLTDADSLNFTTIIQTVLGGKSSNTHFKIWNACFDYLSQNPLVILIGRGAGVENTWEILLNNYGINHPHAHNIIIETMMQVGIVGTALFIAPIFVLLKNTVQIIKQNKQNKVFALTVINSILCFILIGMTDYLFNSPKQIMLLFFVLGIAQAGYNIAMKNTDC